jgi:hypothetical protein
MPKAKMTELFEEEAKKKAAQEKVYDANKNNKKRGLTHNWSMPRKSERWQAAADDRRDRIIGGGGGEEGNSKGLRRQEAQKEEKIYLGRGSQTCRWQAAAGDRRGESIGGSGEECCIREQHRQTEDTRHKWPREQERNSAMALEALEAVTRKRITCAAFAKMVSDSLS